MSQQTAVKLLNESNNLYNRIYTCRCKDHFKYARLLFRASKRFDRRVTICERLGVI